MHDGRPRTLPLMAEVGIQFRPRKPGPSTPAPVGPHPDRVDPPGDGGRKTTRVRIVGMTCGHCAQTATEALRGVPGVASASVDLASGAAEVEWSGPAGDAAVLFQAIERVGYRAEQLGEVDSADVAPANPWRHALWLGVPSTIVLLAGDWLFGWGMNRAFQGFAFGVASVVMAWVGRQFFLGAWNQLRRGRSNMDTLVALGSGAAYGFSAWSLLSGAGHHLFFAEAVTILTLISLGHWLEARMSLRAGDALKALLTLAPATARRMSADAEEVVPVSALRVGDEIVLKPGDQVPVDAEVIHGESALNEAMLTGESVPVPKSNGDRLLTGTEVLNGRLRARVTGVGADTALAKIIAVVRRAQSSRAGIQRLADRVSAVFVPVVVTVACGAALWWWLDFERALALRRETAGWLSHLPPMTTPASAAMTAFCAVLIVACPCAMGLATPVALMAGINAAARRGILIRDAVALEKSGRITAVAFDKTGTLTQGRPEVVDVVGGDMNLEAVRALAAAVARPSHHPLSRAVAAASAEIPAVSEWSETAGQGVAGQIVWEGHQHVVALRAADLSRAPAPVGQWPEAGRTVLEVRLDDRVAGWLAVADPVRSDAAQLVERMRRGGRRLRVVSGDQAATVRAIAMPLGFDPADIFGGVSPVEKARLIEQWRSRDERVAFVGDGINDGPALAQADLGIAVARASDIAREAADLVLLRADLGAVAEALDLADRTLRTIRQNLFWAFFYNAAAVPLAAMGVLSPMICALTMGVSDLIVIGNALRLRWRG
jgi:P-type Cu+ transporter